MKTAFYWNSTTDQHALEWIKTKDEDLFTNHLYYPLKCLATAATRKFKLSGDDTDVQNVLAHLSNALLTYKEGKNTTIFYYLFQVARNYFSREHQTNTYQKRDWRKLVPLPEETEENQSYLESIFGYTPDPTYYDDKDFEAMMLNYWKKNAGKYFKGKRLTTCLLVVDILQYTERHPFKGHSYVEYIAKKVGSSRQAVFDVLSKMKAVNKFLHQKYLTNGLLGLL